MSTYSEEDVAAVQRVAEALAQHPADIHKPELAALKAWAAAAGATFPPAPAPAAAAPEPAAATEAAGDDASEPDEERWTLEADVPAEIPAAAGEVSDADVEAAMAAKGEAAELHSEGKTAEALAKMGEALTLNPNNAMYWGLRALYHLESNKPGAALQDANRALAINPQNVRALRVRGTVNRHLGRWADAVKDLGDAQSIDYDDAVNDTLKYAQARVTQRHKRELERQAAAEEAAVRRQAELRRQRQAEAEAEAAAAAAEAEEARGAYGGGMPGGMGGMPGGMGGMPGGMPPGMDSILQDPEIMAAMQDPEVGPKLAQMMQNPMAAMGMMNDPKVGPIIQKMMSKMMGGAGGMPGGMPGGMGGMPGGMPGGRPAGGAPQGGSSAAQDDLD